MKKTAGVLGIFLLIAYSGFVFGMNNDTTTVSVNILADIVGIEVPESLDFGDVSSGEKSDIFDLYINNTGNIDITVTPELVNNSEEIFSYLFFKRVRADNFTRIGNFSVNISKPTSGVRSQRTYVVLDLEDYDGAVNEDILNHQADVIFWALPQ